MHARLEADQTADRRPAVKPRSVDAAGPAFSGMLLRLQRTAGNAAVASWCRSPAGAPQPQPPVIPIQRCGPVPCNCSAAEHAEYESAHGDGIGPGHGHEETDEAALLQRTVDTNVQSTNKRIDHIPADKGSFARSLSPRQANPARVSTLQRHQGVDVFREKPRLESTELGSVPELQVAVSSAAAALEVGKSSGAGVSRMQDVLRSKGFNAPSTGVYDAATQAAVAKFQADHGIPFPTGRQAGPKTLSTLDDHLLGTKPPSPKPECSQYLPDEREASRLPGSGTSRRLGTFGKELELLNFAAGDERLKPEHQQALKDFIGEFALFDPCTDFKVRVIIGFTDAVDREESNERLRLDRANTVAGFLQTNGVPGAPDGVSADPSTYNTGCDKATRSEARRVAVRLVKREKSETKDCREKPRPPVPPQGCKKNQASDSWSLLSTAAGTVAEVGAAGTFNYVLADTSPDGCKYLLEFTGVGLGGGLSFPATVGVSGATPFKIKNGPIRPTDFTRGGRIILAEGGLVVGFGFQFARFEGLSTDPEPVDLSGVQLSAGADAMVLVGAWTLLPF